MKQIFSGIVTLTLYIACLGFPTNLETPIDFLRFENSTETTALKNESDNIINKNSTEMQTLEFTKLSNTDESKVMQMKVLENTKIQKNEHKFEENESIDKDKLKTEEKKSNHKEKTKKQENYKFIESPKNVTQDKISEQSEVWKDFEDDFSLFEHRLPDLTEEEFIELNKEGAIPWNFLKSLDIQTKVNEENPKPLPIQTPIYINVPIVINTHSTLPISLKIGGHNVHLKVPTNNKDHNTTALNEKAVSGNAMFTATSDYSKPPLRQTNHHRSNTRSKIYARNNNNHEVQAFDYNKDDFYK